MQQYKCQFVKSRIWWLLFWAVTVLNLMWLALFSFCLSHNALLVIGRGDLSPHLSTPIPTSFCSDIIMHACMQADSWSWMSTTECHGPVKWYSKMHAIESTVWSLSQSSPKPEVQYNWVWILHAGNETCMHCRATVIIYRHFSVIEFSVGDPY